MNLIIQLIKWNNTEITKIDFLNESFIYLGDKANMPYGEYSGSNNTPLLKEHIIKDAQFLLGNKYYKNQKSDKYNTDKSQIKALVIACNTATAYGKQDIEKFIEESKLDIKVIGVIGAGFEAHLKTFQKMKMQQLELWQRLEPFHQMDIQIQL